MSLILFVSHHSFISDFLLLHLSSDVVFLLFFQSFCSRAEGSMKFSSWPFAWDPRFLLTFLWALISYSKVTSASLISQSGSFTLPAVMGSTGVALLSQSTLIHRLQWTLCLRPRVRRTSFTAIPQFIK